MKSYYDRRAHVMKSMKLGVAVQRLWCRGLLVHVPARSRTCSTLCNHSPLAPKGAWIRWSGPGWTFKWGGCVYCCTNSLCWGCVYEAERGSGKKLLTRRAGDLRIDCVSAPVVGSAGVLAIHMNAGVQSSVIWYFGLTGRGCTPSAAACPATAAAVLSLYCVVQDV